MENHSLTLIVPVTAGREQELDKFLKTLRADPAGNAVVPFGKLGSIHFARFVLIDSPQCKNSRLLFSLCHDSPTEKIIEELSRLVGPGLDDIFSYCVNYPRGAWTNPERAMAFVRQYLQEPNTSVAAFRGVSVYDIKNAAEARRNLEALADLPPMRDLVHALNPRPLRTDAPLESEGPSLITRLGDKIVEWILGSFGGGRGSQVLVTAGELTEVEDQIAQNQMTIVSPNRPGWSRLTLRVVLWAANWNASRKRAIASLPTIHFAQWTMIDGGDNLLFQSNYNGTWENYIDDFIDYAHVGLDAIWGHCPDYPEGGCRNIEAFKNVIRRFQHPAQVYYSAYPAHTVAHIAEDLKLASELRPALAAKGLARVITGSHPQLPDWTNS